ncbi:MAG TPA: ATP-binding cassette domain-containing protein [Ruminococcus sp.]
MEILKVENLSFTYPLCSEPTVRSVSFSVEKGEFIVLCGATGSGKSTLLHTLKRELTPNGELTGKIIFEGAELSSLEPKRSAAEIGFVMQSPQHQIVTDKVWHELAFGLESLGLPQDEISRRVAETASAFGLGELYERETEELSGGQKQLLSLAAVLVMQPKLLILDEPTAQLDPIAASEFITTVKKLNQDYGITVIMSEHRLEEAVTVCDRLMVMENGTIIVDDIPEKAVSCLGDRPDILRGMPSAARLFTELNGRGICPLTVRSGRSFIEKNYGNFLKDLPEEKYIHSSNAAIEFSNVFFRYEKKSPDILKGMTLKVYEGELFCVLGGNGSGKTSFLKAASGLVKPYSGSIKIFGEKLSSYKNQSLYRNCLTMLPQDVQTVFLKNTVREELEECGANTEELPFNLSQIMDKHPYDISGGQQQLVALAKALASDPRLILLDEPTKGLDAMSKLRIISVLRSLTNSGTTVLIVTHDVEFAAECSDRCALFFNGKTAAPDIPRRFFSKNSFYTTAVSRMTRGIFGSAATVADAVKLCRMNSERGGIS